MQVISPLTSHFPTILIIGKPLENLKGKNKVFISSNIVLAKHTLLKFRIKPDIVIINDKNEILASLNAKLVLQEILKKHSFLFLVTSHKSALKYSQKYSEIDDIISPQINYEHVITRNKIKKFKASVDDLPPQPTSISLSKRIFDITFASLALLMLSPILLLVIVAIKIDSKGPILYTSPRVGKGYKIFNFYKFRTMKQGADKLVDNLKKFNQYSADNNQKTGSCEECSKLKNYCSPPLYFDDAVVCEKSYLKYIGKNDQAAFFKLENDPRVTLLGKFLRKSSIDELPQLINIIKGDMSIVGNRPIPLYEAEKLTDDSSSERFLAPSGLTGLWQISKRGQAEMSIEERKELDNSYYRQQSFWGDIVIILKTIPAMLQKANV